MKLPSLRRRRRERGLVDPMLGFTLAALLPALVTTIVWRVDDPGYRLGTLFVAAVAVTAAIAGTVPAMVTAAIGLVGFWYTVTPPNNSFALEWPDGVYSLVAYVLCCTLILVVGHQRDEQVRRRAAFQRRYRRLADIGLIGVLFWRTDGTVSAPNDAFLAMVGHTREDFAAGRIDWAALTPPEYHALDAAKLAELATAGYHEPYEKEYLRADGSRVAVLVGTAFLEGSDRDGITFVVDVTERWRLEQERERLLAAEQRARSEAEAATRRLHAVAEASARLMARLDPEEVLAELVDVVVPELADVAAVFVPEGDLLRRARVAYARQPELDESFSLRFPVTLGSDSPVARCFRSGETIEVGATLARATMPTDQGADYQRAVAAMAIGDSVAVPLRAGDEVLGVLTLSGTDGRGGLDPGAVLAAEQIADRAGTALQKAQSFAAERRVATIMQRALLPDGRRSVEGHEVSTCYVPAAVGREIGGDWWDVLALPDGRSALVIGDVAGHGIHVAPSMAKLRHSIDGVLMHGAGPAAAATAASRLLEVNRPGSYATAFIAVYDPATRALTYSRAGHPPPVVLLPDDVIHLDHGGGTLLGLNLTERAETTVTLPARFELVAFTDGLVEEPGLDYDIGIDRLVDAVRRLPHDLRDGDRAGRLVDDLVGTSGRDDVCVLMLRPASAGPAAS